MSWWCGRATASRWTVRWRKAQSAVDQAPSPAKACRCTSTGDEVFAGTINQTAALDVRVTRLARDNTLSRVLQMVQEAQSQQSPTQQFTERFTAGLCRPC